MEIIKETITIQIDINMKKWMFILVLLRSLLVISTITFSNNQSTAQNLQWLSFEQAMIENKFDKKLIFIDVYTSWCRWCKVMDRKTFANERVKAFLYKNFHNVKLDAEQKGQIQFGDKTFKWVNTGKNGIHQLAYSLLKGDLSYPSFVVLDSNFKRIKIIKGYQKPDYLLQQLKPIVEKYNKTSKFKFPEVEQTSETEQSLKTYLNSNKLSKIEGIYKSYQSDHLGYYKIGIRKFKEKYKAVIVESDFKHWQTGEVKAIFEQSSMNGLYSTKWYLGNKTPYETFAFMETPSVLAIEFDDPSTREKRLSKFIKMYPTSDSNVPSINDGNKISGSGFVVSSDGVIATNAHVIENSDRIDVSLNTELGLKTYTATVLLKDEANDIALLRIEDDKFKEFKSLPYSILKTTEIGEDVFTIGYPLNSLMGDNYKVTNGIISSNTGLKDDIRYIQITTPIQPGNSGGPLFNKDGNIVGITTAKLDENAVGTSIENVNYAIKASYLLNIYDMLPSKKHLNKNSTLVNQELKDQVRILKNYVCLINAY